MINNRIVINPNIKVRKSDDLLDLPVYVKVNDFDEPALKLFEEAFSKALNTSQPVVPILIDSYGGYVDSLMAMIDIIKSSNKPVATVVSGKAMSCGAILFSCGKEGMRYVGEHARVMIHDVSSWSSGKVEEIKADAAETERLNKMVYTLMARNVGKPDNYFLNIVHDKSHADWFLTSEECVKHNLANQIGLPSFEVNVDLNINFK